MTGADRPGSQDDRPAPQAPGRAHTMTPMPEQIDLSEGAWDDLLDFLDPRRREKQGLDRDSDAEARYIEITRKLVCFFAGRGRGDADDLAVTTILRVAARCGSVNCSGDDDRMRYFYGVAWNVLQETWRASVREAKASESLKTELLRLPMPDPDVWDEEEAVHRCLDRCMAGLLPRARRLMLSYYGGEAGAKIEGHKNLADQFGKSVNALRIEVHKVRKALRQCVFSCLRPDARGKTSGTRPTLEAGRP